MIPDFYHRNKCGSSDGSYLPVLRAGAFTEQCTGLAVSRELRHYPEAFGVFACAELMSTAGCDAHADPGLHTRGVVSVASGSVGSGKVAVVTSSKVLVPPSL